MKIFRPDPVQIKRTVSSFIFNVNWNEILNDNLICADYGILRTENYPDLS